MKRFLPFLFLTSIAFGEEESLLRKQLDKAEEELRKAHVAYQTSFAEAITHATHVEVYLLDAAERKKADPFDDSPKEFFPVLPYESVVRIKQTKKLTPEELQLLMPALKVTLTPARGGKSFLCHDPIHGIRVWDDGELVFQTSVCYTCNNFYRSQPGGDAFWVPLPNTQLQEVMEKLMPIPETVDEGKDEKKPAR